MSTPKANGGNVQPWASRHHAERGTPAGSLKSFTARLSFKARQVLQSLKDKFIMAAAALCLFCAAGSVVVFVVMLMFMRF